MGGCLASFIGMALASRELADTMPILQILLLRSIVGLVVVMLLMRHLLPELTRVRDLRLHGIRNAIHFSAQYCWTVGVALLPLAYVFALEFTMPIWVALFAWAILGERLRPTRIIAIVISFWGVLIVLQPGSSGFSPAMLIVLLAAVGYGASAVLVKRLTMFSSSAVIVVWMVVMQLPMALIMLLVSGGWVVPDWPDIPWIVLVGLSGLSAHYTMAQALRVVDVSVAIPIDFLRVPLIAVIGWMFYGEAISIAVFVGASLIFGANYMAMRAEILHQTHSTDRRQE
jgi:S-adenosylmethionine uptake transporter